MMKSMKAMTEKEEKEVEKDLHMFIRACDLMDFVKRYYWLELKHPHHSNLHMERINRTESISIDCIRDYAIRFPDFGYYGGKPDIVFMKIFNMFLFDKRITLDSPDTFRINETFFDPNGIFDTVWEF